METKIPERLTYRRKEVIQLTKLDGRVLDYWEKEFGSPTPVINQSGEKFYSKRDLEIILKIKNLLVVEKIDKEKVKQLLRQDFPGDELLVAAGGNPAVPPKPDQIKRLRSSLKEILTILDKDGKK